jgi:hypothetical protein
MYEDSGRRPDSLATPYREDHIMETVHTARTDDGQRWVSLTGDAWLPVDQFPGAGDYERTVALFAMRTLADGSRRQRITYANRWLQMVNYPDITLPQIEVLSI